MPSFVGLNFQPVLYRLHAGPEGGEDGRCGWVNFVSTSPFAPFIRKSIETLGCAQEPLPPAAACSCPPALFLLQTTAGTIYIWQSNQRKHDPAPAAINVGTFDLAWPALVAALSSACCSSGLLPLRKVLVRIFSGDVKKLAPPEHMHFRVVVTTDHGKSAA